jgi:DNA-directed RNA polymerase specialized sigma24 family protein
MEPIPYKTKRGKTKKPTDEELASLYAQYTAKEIAEKFEVKEATVRSWIARQRAAARAEKKEKNNNDA